MFTNSKKYSPAADHYLGHGFYTDAIPGTREYYDYWDEQKKRWQDDITYVNRIIKLINDSKGDTKHKTDHKIKDLA